MTETNGTPGAGSEGAAPREGAPARVTRADQAAEAPQDAAATDGAVALRAQLEDLQAQHLRLAADFENYRRRRTQEQAERARYASEDAARALLPVIDNLRRAIDAAPPGTDERYLQGIHMVERQLDDALASLGILPIPAAGERFDPSVHEAISGEASADVDEDMVIEEVQRGYRLHDRVVRPALVRVVHPVHSA